MSLKHQTESSRENEEALLQDDARWALVNRILGTEGFQRASQLRRILLYVSKSAILQPDEVLSEFEIATDVLERRPDFDPTNDNIVRQQVSHLRRKLKHYFDTEGQGEPLVLTIPKGNYIPVFTPVQVKASLPMISERLQDQPTDAPTVVAIPSSVRRHPALSRWRNWALGVALLFNVALIISALIFWQKRHAEMPKNERSSFANPFVQLLARSQGDVTVVVPDTSFALIQDVLGTNIPISDYIDEDFPQKQATTVNDPAIRHIILMLGDYRTTSVDEALIATDFQATLQRVGVHATIRYARDLHMSDLNAGNSVLIGGPNSDPWASMFIDQINFHHDDNLSEHKHYFENLHPAPGEQPRYENVYSRLSVGYVDVALVQNLSRSGYVLLIDGADKEANEAAARFLLHGNLPPEITSVLNRKDLRYFEFLLRGRHIEGEADNSFSLIAVRLK